jgi:hypothetical protein
VYHLLAHPHHPSPASRRRKKLHRTHFGFTEMGYINNDQIGFVLDMETSQKSFAVKYRETLVETKNKKQSISHRKNNEKTTF